MVYGGYGSQGGGAGGLGGNGKIYYSSHTQQPVGGAPESYLGDHTDTHTLIQYLVDVNNHDVVSNLSFSTTLAMPYQNFTPPTPADTEEYFWVCLGFFTKDGSSDGDWGEMTHDGSGTAVNAEMRLQTPGNHRVTIHGNWAQFWSTGKSRIVTTAKDPKYLAWSWSDDEVSLREALTIAHPRMTDADGTYTITFGEDFWAEAGTNAVITLTNGGIRCGADMTVYTREHPLWIVGPATNSGRRLTIRGVEGQTGSGFWKNGGLFSEEVGGCCCKMTDITLENGRAQGLGGAISSYSSWEFERVAFSNNVTVAPPRIRLGDIQGGGAVYVGRRKVNGQEGASCGEISFRDCILEENQTQGPGGAIRQWGKTTNRGATVNHVFFENCSFRKNIAGEAAGGNGGALVADGEVAGNAGRIVAVNCSFCDNRCTGVGGGIAYAHGRLLSVANTFRMNWGKKNGGIATLEDTTDNELYLLNSVLTGNQSSDYTYNNRSDVWFYGGTHREYFTLVKNGRGITASEADHVYIDGDHTVDTYVFEVPRDERWYDLPQQSVYNGVTHWVEPLNRQCLEIRYAPAVYHDAVYQNVAFARTMMSNRTESTTREALLGSTGPAMIRLGHDLSERGLQISSRSMGSYWLYVPEPTLVVTSLDDVMDEGDGYECLREIISYVADPHPYTGWRWTLVNTNDWRFDITFTNTLAGTAVQKLGVIDLSNFSNVTLAVHGHTVSNAITLAGDGRRLFNVGTANRLELHSLTLTNGFAEISGYNGPDGGAILNRGSLLVSNCVFSGNACGPKGVAPQGMGGAIHTTDAGDAFIFGSSFLGNSAAYGGAVSVNANGALTVLSSTFADNAAVSSLSVPSAAGGAAYVKGASASAIFASDTFTRNSAAGGLISSGGAVFAANAGATGANVSLVDCVAVGNGDCDLGLVTGGSLHLYGTVYGSRDTRNAGDWSTNGCTEAKATDVFAHTTSAGVAIGREAGTELPLQTVFALNRDAPEGKLPAHTPRVLGYLRWTNAGYTDADGVNRQLRGRNKLLFSKGKAHLIDQLGKTLADGWLGSVDLYEAKATEDPPAEDPDASGAIKEATEAALKDAVAAALADPNAETAVVYVTGAASNATIAVTEAIEVPAGKTLVVRGPVTLEADGLTRFFTVRSGGRLVLKGVTLVGGDASLYTDDEGSAGGAVKLADGATLVATDCTFRGNRAEYGGAVCAAGLDSAQAYVRCVFAENVASAEGNAIYYDSETSRLVLVETQIAADDVWPEAPSVTLTDFSALPTAGAKSVQVNLSGVKAGYRYALEHAETPVGPYTVEESGWVEATEDGTLPKPLTAPATGSRGFYRLVVE